MTTFVLTLGENQLTQKQLDQIKQHLPEGTSFVHTDQKKEVLALGKTVEIIAGWFGPTWLQGLPNLRWAQFWGAGTDWLFKYPDLQQRPFILTNGSGIHAISISEHILGVMLNYGRNLRTAHDAQKAHHWLRIVHPSEPIPESFPFSWDNLVELAGKTLLLLGVGAIGERTAKLAKAFDMHVIGLRHNPSKISPFVDQMVGHDQFLDVLPKADFIAASLPSTPETRHFINATAIANMKPTAYLINVGRGDAIEETALLTALKQKRIAGAALDVFEAEPLPPDAPHWELENLTITAHYSGGSPNYHQRALQILLENLTHYQNGTPMRSVVNKLKGY